MNSPPEFATYRVAATAAAEAFARARQTGCTLQDHVVLEAVIALTALSGRLATEVAVAVVAERASLHPKNAARALGRLRDRGVISYEAGRGRGHLSRIGLLEIVPELGLASRTEIQQADDREIAGLLMSETPVLANGRESTDAPSPERESNLDHDVEGVPELQDVPEAEGALDVDRAPEVERVPDGGEELAGVSEVPGSPGPGAPQVESVAEVATGPGGETDAEPVRALSPEAELAFEVLALFNERAGTDHRFEDWGDLIVARILERPGWAFAEWCDAVRRAFAVAWWEKTRPPSRPPTPRVIFSSGRQVDSTLNVPDRLVELAESSRRTQPG